jgi:hypothetical protein
LTAESLAVVVTGTMAAVAMTAVAAAAAVPTGRLKFNVSPG